MFDFLVFEFPNKFVWCGVVWCGGLVWCGGWEGACVVRKSMRHPPFIPLGCLFSTFVESAFFLSSQHFCRRGTLSSSDFKIILLIDIIWKVI